MRVKFNSETEHIFMIGDPIEHTCSGYLHNTMYELANVNAVCTVAKIPKGSLPQFVESVKLLGSTGFDLTTPHKTDIIPFLDELDDVSRVFTSVNHVKVNKNKLIGIGLDGEGMGSAIEHAIKNKNGLSGASVLIIGAGSVAGPIAADLCKRGAERIHIANRTVEKAQIISEKLHKMYSVSTSYGPLNNSYLIEHAEESNIVVQCTSIGLNGDNNSYFPFEFLHYLPNNCLIADVLYPESLFLDAASELGFKTLNGMGMLLHQQLSMIDFRFGIKLDPKCLSIAEESLAAAIAVRKLNEHRNHLRRGNIE